MELTGLETRVEAISKVSLFGGLADELRDDGTPLNVGPWARLATLADSLHLSAGDWLFRENDAADSMFILMAGRLEVVVEGAEETVIRELTSGNAVGELALLTGEPRSASVRARRDCELLRISRPQFEEVLESDPDFAVALTRSLGKELQGNRSAVRGDETPPLPSVVAVVPLDSGASVQKFGAYLCGALAGWGDIVGIDRPGEQFEGEREEFYGHLLDRGERQHDKVVLLVYEPLGDDPWAQFCVRQADRVIAISSGAALDSRTLHPRLKGCDLVYTTDDVRTADLRPLTAALDPRVTYAVPAGAAYGGHVEAIARRLAGRSVGVVLSGGGARGFAHIGVIEELLAAGVEIDRFGGCSAGAYIAAQFAMGKSAEEVAATCREEFVDRNPMNDYTLPLVALTRRHKAEEMLIRTFGDATIETLEHEFFSVSCDLVTSELVVHRRGRVWEATGASMALPGVFPPVAAGGALLVDGGVLNNLPVDVMAATGEGPAIAVDVSNRFEPPACRGTDPTLSRRARATSRARELVVGSGAPLPSFGETLIRSIVLGSVDTTENAERHAELVIKPDTRGIGLTQWERIDHLRQAGREAARAAIAVAGDTFKIAR